MSFSEEKQQKVGKVLWMFMALPTLAVATETFFEKPVQLRKEHPELYEELYGFYRVNPVEWE
jgi:Mlc titration factor MtfA (ptsG expression regulator)